MPSFLSFRILIAVLAGILIGVLSMFAYDHYLGIGQQLMQVEVQLNKVQGELTAARAIVVKPSQDVEPSKPKGQNNAPSPQAPPVPPVNEATPPATAESKPANTSSFSLRVNCGGGEFKDDDGIEWLADQMYKDGSWGFVDGDAVDRSLGDHKKMTGAKDIPMYLTERFGMSAYRFTVPNGKYTVVLHFNETYYGTGGVAETFNDDPATPRRFNVTLNGKPVLSNFSPLQEAGGANYTPVVRSFETETTDGRIEINFKQVDASPEINGIEIIGK